MEGITGAIRGFEPMDLQRDRWKAGRLDSSLGSTKNTAVSALAASAEGVRRSHARQHEPGHARE